MGTDERFWGAGGPKVFHLGANAIPGDLRVDRRFKVSIQVGYGEGGDPRRASVFDIGADGVFVRTRTPLDPGTAVDLSILIPGHTEIEVGGTVVWANLVGTEALPEGMGVRFTRIDPVARLLLRQHITALA